MKWFYFSALLLLLQTACTPQPPLSGTLTFPGDDSWAHTVYLIQPRNLDEVAASFAGTVIDSAVVDEDGHFSFENLPDVPEPVLLELAVQQRGERYLNRLNEEDLATANYFPIVWKNGEVIQVTVSADQFQRSFTINDPSSANAALLQLRDVRHEAFQQFLQHYQTEEHDPSQLLQEEAAQLSFQKALIDFANQTDQLLPTLVAIRWVSPENDFERVPEFLVAQCQKWNTTVPDHPWTAQLCEKSSREQLPVLKGDPMPNADLPMLSGDTMALYQMLGQKLTILDLWASWCAPCRKENREVLVPLWEKYHENGFQIMGYALDGSENAWKKAIEKDGAYRWPHASHLQGDDAPLLEVLRIQTIPANFLLDTDGVVVAKNLHGEALVEFVEEFMKK